MTTTSEHRVFDGICVSPGIGIGRAFAYDKQAPVITRQRVAQHLVGEEIERFRNILHQAGDEIRRIRRWVASEQGEELAQIFDAQLAMLEDPSIKERTEALILDKHYSAERAYAQELEKVKEAFGNIENEYLRARVSDVADIENQVLMRLAGGEVKALDSLRANTIVLAHDLLPSEMVRLERRRIKGVVLDAGGAASHAAIIARSLQLPTVVGTGGLFAASDRRRFGGRRWQRRSGPPAARCPRRAALSSASPASTPARARPRAASQLARCYSRRAGNHIDG